ncbi:hypothetical protein CCUS01_13045 [Colletotrichum cuscutae]|uniref:Uncharacterized protein n=1 Tax=Colletotrichum cuscutae TaxID=1209917 RepID=A0AAI9YCS3_9PEZI|nr:hypothetical protein CCUS01_13045 [Colletotrichum cuscutae]
MSTLGCHGSDDGANRAIKNTYCDDSKIDQGWASEETPRPSGMLRAFFKEPGGVQESLLYGKIKDTSSELQKTHSKLCAWEAAFSRSFSARADESKLIIDSGSESKRHSDPEIQSGKTHEPAITDSGFEILEPLPKPRSSVEHSPVYQELTLGDEDATKLTDSNMDPGTTFLSPSRKSSLGELSLKGSVADDYDDHRCSEGSSREEREREMNNGYHAVEASTRRVLSASPEYAEAVVAAYQRRLQGFEPQGRSHSEVSALLASALQRRYVQSEQETVDEETSSTQKRSTSNDEAANGGASTSSSTTAPAGSAIRNHKPATNKRNREEEEKDPKKRLSSKKPCHKMPEKHWLCPYGVRYPKWATGACRTPTKFRSFSELKNHLRLRHRMDSQDGEEPKHPELYMSYQQWNDIEIVANEASKKRPKQGTEASFDKQLGMFRAVWRILFPDAGSGPKSPFCEDFIANEIEMLSDSIFDSRSQQAFERGEVSTPNEYRATRAEFTESMQQLFAILADYMPEIEDLVPELIASATPGILSDHQLPGTFVDEGPSLSHTAAGALRQQFAGSSELTATSSHAGHANSPQASSSHSVSGFAGGMKIDDQRPQQGINHTILQLDPETKIPTSYLDSGALRSEFGWSGTVSSHTEPESSQSMGNCHPLAAQTRAPLPDPGISDLFHMPFDASLDFDWEEGKQIDSKGTSADWRHSPICQPDEDIEDPWQEFLNMNHIHILGFAEPSPPPDPVHDREDEEPQPQPIDFDRPAPRKKLQPKPKTIVHSAPSHDGIPAFVAYSVPADTPEDADLTPLRPAYAYVFYDTSPGALDPRRTEDLARAIFDGTKDSRSSDGLPDRVEVFAIPLPPLPETGSPYSAEDVGLGLVLSQESPWYARLAARASRDPQDAHCLQHAAACILHHEREVQNRLAIADRAEAVSWYLPEGLSNAFHTRRIVVVDRLNDKSKNLPGLIRWQEALAWTQSLPSEARDPDINMAERAESSPYGRGLLVKWRPRDQDDDDEEDEETLPLNWDKVAFEMLGESALSSCRYGVDVLYEHFIPDGVFDFEREKARERGVVDGVDLPMQAR